MTPFLNSIDHAECASLPQDAGLYFITDTKEILYVGQSANLNKRWKAHHLRQQIAGLVASGETVRIVWISLDKDSAEKAERVILQHFWPRAPRYNCTTYTSDILATHDKWLVFLADKVSDCGLHKRGSQDECPTCVERKALSEEIAEIERGVNPIVDALSRNWGLREFKQMYHRKGLEMLAMRMPEIAGEKLRTVERNEKRIAEIDAASKRRVTEAMATLALPWLGITLRFDAIAAHGLGTTSRYIHARPDDSSGMYLSIK